VNTPFLLLLIAALLIAALCAWLRTRAESPRAAGLREANAQMRTRQREHDRNRRRLLGWW